MNIIKRSGKEEIFDLSKIHSAISKAADATPEESLNEQEISKIADDVEHQCNAFNRAVDVEEIQNLVEEELMRYGFYKIARNYITYRYRHNENRKMSTIDQRIYSLINRENEEVKQENSNKNPVILSVQRDYMAGEWSKYFVNRYILPEDIAQAHKDGIIHYHDQDFGSQKYTNCCLINLEDMLQNGTVISGTRIDPPKSFLTACTVTSQIVAMVASAQYGGQTFSLAHLAPFVDVSRKKIRKRLGKEFEEMGVDIDAEKLDVITEKELKKEVDAGCQCIQYQLITLQSTNG